MKTRIATTQRIKSEIKAALKKVPTKELIAEVTEAKNSSAPEAIILFTFGLNELEDRMTEDEYNELEWQLSAN